MKEENEKLRKDTESLSQAKQVSGKRSLLFFGEQKVKLYRAAKVDPQNRISSNARNLDSVGLNALVIRSYCELQKFCCLDYFALTFSYTVYECKLSRHYSRNRHYLIYSQCAFERIVAAVFEINAFSFQDIETLQRHNIELENERNNVLLKRDREIQSLREVNMTKSSQSFTSKSKDKSILGKLGR